MPPLNVLSAVGAALLLALDVVAGGGQPAAGSGRSTACCVSRAACDDVGASAPKGAPITPPPHFHKLAHTYSIVAWDPDNGDLGVAVQSKFPNVGGIVPWAKAGVG